MRKVKLIVPEPEYQALFKLAIRELRTPNDQIVWLIRREAERQGLLHQYEDRHDQTEAPVTEPAAARSPRP
ncbi:MAG TPA: hypothetical protein DEF43_08365 [Chloroflexus aurantiacus]|uniref:hypothetical protein n=1 Tax=Chloroflexus TaxID=1107 RepID=UPI0000458D6C|nr:MULTISPECIES: hypothetical protein [Chloroflexus]GIV89879.1 MAG: hypothetical protein KatS3mg055_2397 [Chloroflexus sp.]HBW67160.1 hypothetical protein [Chloroflexus aurantiacus]